MNQAAKADHLFSSAQVASSTATLAASSGTLAGDGLVNAL